MFLSPLLKLLIFHFVCEIDFLFHLFQAVISRCQQLPCIALTEPLSAGESWLTTDKLFLVELTPVSNKITSNTCSAVISYNVGYIGVV